MHYFFFNFEVSFKLKTNIKIKLFSVLPPYSNTLRGEFVTQDEYQPPFVITNIQNSRMQLSNDPNLNRQAIQK